MPFSYTPGGTDELSKVRFILGDTDSADPQLQDDEISVFFDAGMSVDSAAIACARALRARYARYVDKWVGDLKILASQRFRQYSELVTKLESGAPTLSGFPVSTALHVADKDANEADTSIVQGAFRVGLHDNE